MTEKYIKLSKLLSKKAVNWNEVESIIKSLGTHINDKLLHYSYEEGTILSELFLDSHTYQRGEILVELTKIFLKYGYDVHANNDFNGAICLHNLCWASYDKYTLHTAELLLNAGANTHIKIEEDYEEGVLNSISWKFGYWNIEEYDSANMFVAYYEMIKTEQSGEDYRGIRDVSDCLNMTVTKVECMNIPEVRDNNIIFDDAIILWFDSTPLVLDKRIELVINPNRANKSSCHIDLSTEFSKIIGQKFIKYRFLDPVCVSLLFENNSELVLSNNMTPNEEDLKGLLVIKS